MANNFKLRNGAGKMNSYSAMQEKGLISPMQVEEPPKKKGRMITELSNREIYNLDKKGYFEKNPAEMKRLMNTPTSSGSSTLGKEYQIWSGGRDKEVASRMKVGQLTDKPEDLEQWQKDHINAPDQVKDYGKDEMYKKTAQQAGNVYDDKGETVYPGQEGHTEGYLKQKAEGYSEDVEVKRL